MNPQTTLSSVLIVDDEPAVRDLMTRWASSQSFAPSVAANADEALATLRTHHYDLAVIDVMMPGRDGLWLANELKHTHPDTAVVLATAYSDLLAAEGPQFPLADLLIKPFERDRFLLAMDRGRQWRKQAIEEMRWHGQLALELDDRIFAITKELIEAGADGRDELAFLVEVARERVPDTIAHCERVARYAVSVAQELAFDDDLELLEQAARLHDIGKLAVPEAVMTKPSPLTTGEVAIMRRHVEAGAEILASTNTLRALAPVVFASHEWFNGGGYPRQISGEDIPLASRIVAICDAYDVMTQGRPYASGMDSAEAIAEILRCSAGQFDPRVAAAFLAVLSRH